MTSLTCLSPDPHEDNIKDPILHFLGCVEISTRNEFLETPSNVQSPEGTATEETAPEGTASETTEVQSDGNEQNRDIDEQKKAGWREDCLSELRRIAFLRFKLQEDEKEKHLVEKIEGSRQAWRESEVFNKGIQEIRKWRGSPESSNEEGSEEQGRISNDAYNPGRDVNTPFMLFKKQKDSNSIYEPDKETKDQKNAIWGKFPNQKTNVQRLLFDKQERNLLCGRNYEKGKKHLGGRDDDKEKERLGGRDDKEKIRYFHIPSNNMLVSIHA